MVFTIERIVMSQPESKLSRRIMDELRLEGYFCYKVHGDEYTMVGLPDIIVCAEGLFIGLEVKMPTTRSHVSPRQVYVAGLITNAGGKATVVCSPKEALNFIRNVLANRPNQITPKGNA